MKKFNFLMLILIFFLIIALQPCVHAIEQSSSLSTDIVGLINGITDILKPVSEKIVGETVDSQWLFAKVLLLILVFSIVWAVLFQVGFFSRNDWVLWIVSISVSILSVRWIFSDEIIKTILLPYTSLGVFISAGLPFVIYSIVVTVGMKNAPPTARRLAWIFFGIIFTGMWIARINDMGKFGYIYLVFGIASFIMIKMDGTFQRWQRVMEVEKTLDVVNFEIYAKLLKKRDEVQDALILAKKTGSNERIITELGGKLGRINSQLVKVYGHKN